VCRHYFHDDIWIACLENKLRKTNDNIVISDVRFPNEIKAIHNAKGLVIRVKRGDEPIWYNSAKTATQGLFHDYKSAINELKKYGVHESEYSWVSGKIDYTIENNSTVDHLFSQIKNQLLDLPSSTVT